MRISVVSGVYLRPYSSSRGRRKSNAEVDYNSKSTSFGGVRELLEAIFGHSEGKSKGGKIINFYEATFGKNWDDVGDVSENELQENYDNLLKTFEKELKNRN